MRIGVASGAGEPLEMELGGDAGAGALVAVSANNRGVAAGQLEAKLLVHGKSEGRRDEPLYRVTGFALAEVGCLRELALVIVAMTVSASAELNLVNRCRACRGVTFRALYVCMFAQQRIGGRAVVGYAELNLLEPFDGVTRFALPSISAFRELAAMGIFMAIGAEAE